MSQDKTIHVPPPATPRPVPDLPPTDPGPIGTNYGPTLRPYCSWCGAATTPHRQSAGYDSMTGKRNVSYTARCPRWRWWKPWHESNGLVLPPPPRDRG